MAYVSPGVYTKIIDLSEYVRNVPSTIGFICIVSEKGRDNELVFTNARDFYMEFGEPNINYGGAEYGQGMYVADSFLRNSDSLYVIRVMDETAATYANLLFVGENEGSYGTDQTSSLFLTSAASLIDGEAVDTVVASDNLGTLESLSPGYLSEYNTAAYTAALMIRGRGRGDWYNYFKIMITPHANTVRAAEGMYILDIYKRQETQDYDTDTGQWVDSYAIAATFEVSFNPEKMESGASVFIEDVVNKYFDDLVVVADRDVCREMELSGCDWSLPFLDGAIALENGGGDQATINNAEQLLVNAYSGSIKRVNNDYEGYGNPEEVDEVLDTDNYYFTIVLDGGYPDDVKTAIHDLCMDRADCVGLLDLGDNKSASESITARQNTYTYNTYHIAMYECYSKIYDKYTGRDIWVTPIYHMANVLPYTDNVAELWWAPAGFNRATLPRIKRLRYSPRQGDRDRLYLEQINPIVKFNVGYTVWGQLTSQKRPTAMQDLNITRLVLYIKRALEQFCKFYVFELNDEETWSRISGNIDKFLKMIQNKRGLYSYSVEVGATEYEIKAKQCHVNVTLNPTRVIEQIHLNFYII